MDVQTVVNDPTLVSRKTFDASFEQVFSGGLSLKTQEGDVVQISAGFQEAFSQSSSSTEFADGVVNQELSIAALSASRFSLVVQGDLNEEELAAIQQLVDKVDPIATNFFAGGEFNLEGATASLTENLGVIQELELSLEKSVTAVFSSTSFTRLPASAIPAGTIQPPVETGLPDLANIRNVSALITTTVETAFTVRAAQALEGQEILSSLQDLLDFLKQRLTAFANPGQQPFEAQSEQADGPVVEASNTQSPPDITRNV